MTRDVTHTEQPEVAVPRLAAIVGSSYDPIISKDLNSVVTSWNAAAERLFGYSGAEMIGEPIARIIPSELQEEENRIIERILADGAIVHYETKRVAKDGRVIDVELTISPIKDANRQVIGAATIVRDITDRKTSEIQAAQLAAIVESSYDAILSKDLNSVVTTWNPAAERIFGYRAAEMIGQPIKRIIPADLWGDEDRLVERVRSEGSVVHYVTKRVAKDGRLLDVSLTLSSMRNGVGVVVGDSKIARDVTEQKQAEQRLRASEELLSIAKAAAGIGIYDWDVTTNLVGWDARVRELWGANAAETITFDTFTAGVHPEDYPGVQKAINRAHDPAGDGVYYAEYRVIHRTDGQARWIAATGQAFFVEGRAVRLVGTVQDITERKHAQAQLAREIAAMTRLEELGNLYVREGDFDLILAEIVDAAISITEADFGDIQLLDPESGDLRIAGQSGFPQWWLDFWNSVSRGQGACGTALEQRERVIVEDVERDPIFVGTPSLEVQRKAGVRAVQSTPLMSRSGRPLGTFSTHYRTPGRPDEAALRLLDLLARQAADLIDRSQAEQALREADRHKDEFLAMLGHELRNPLAPIKNGLYMLQSGVEGAKAKRVHDMMSRQIDHLVRLVDDLLEVSRISQGRIELRKESLDLAQVVEDAVSACWPLMDELGHRLSISLPSARLPLEADPTRLTQVLVNLLNNAAKFTNHGGRIEISARREASEAVVSVRDSGVGIPADELTRIFDLFTRIERGLDHSRGGLGVGLALAKSLVEMHGGRIEARSEGVGRGSLFTVRLPLASVAEAQEEAAKHAQAASVRRILVVDDNRDVADSLVMLLETWGEDVHVAYDGRSALEIVAASAPEVVFLDLGMPGMDGYETARRLRQLPEGRGVLLVALTGWGQENDRLRAKEAGFDKHLTKPVNASILEEVLAERL